MSGRTTAMCKTCTVMATRLHHIPSLTALESNSLRRNGWRRWLARGESKDWRQELEVDKIFREILAAYGGVHMEDIRGMRAPFLAIGVSISSSPPIWYHMFQGNPMFTMLHEANFTYDSSMPIYENQVAVLAASWIIWWFSLLPSPSPWTTRSSTTAWSPPARPRWGTCSLNYQTLFLRPSLVCGSCPWSCGMITGTVGAAWQTLAATPQTLRLASCLKLVWLPCRASTWWSWRTSSVITRPVELPLVCSITLHSL